MSKEPMVFIPIDLKQRLDLYIKHATTEISGLGEVEKVKGGVLVKSILLFKQTCSYAQTRLNGTDLSNFLVEAVNQGADPYNLRLWWHSHCDMGVFWSVTDEDTIEAFQMDWMVSIVGNKRGQYRTRLDVLEPFEMTFDHMRLDIIAEEDLSLARQIASEIDAKVKVAPQRQWWKDKKYNAGYGGGWSHGGWNQADVIDLDIKDLWEEDHKTRSVGKIGDDDVIFISSPDGKTEQIIKLSEVKLLGQQSEQQAE